MIEFPGFDDKLALNENGEVGKKAVHERMAEIGPAYKKLGQLVQSQNFIDMVSKITSIPNLLYDKHYFGGGTHEYIQRLYKKVSYQMDELNKLKKVFGPLWKLSWPLRKVRRYFKKQK